jgi:hypothetical protein
MASGSNTADFSFRLPCIASDHTGIGFFFFLFSCFCLLRFRAGKWFQHSSLFDGWMAFARSGWAVHGLHGFVCQGRFYYHGN